MENCKILCLVSILFISGYGYSQNNVGINVAVPTQALSIDRGLNIDHNNQNTGENLLNGLRFGNTDVSLQIVGISSNRSGANPYSLDFYTGNTRRMIISSSGFVGINAIPSMYYFEVGGTIKGNTLRSAGSIFAEGGRVEAELSMIAGTSITAGNNITALNNITSSEGDIVANNGELRAGNRGVIMSNSQVRQKIVAYTATLGVTNLAAGSSVIGNINISGAAFTAAPTAYVGNVITENGDFFKAMLVLENVTTTNVSVRVVNVTTSPITFSDAQWRIMTIGNY